MVWIDNSKCIGCNLCVEACPQGFSMQGNLAVVKDGNAPCVKAAIAACPVNAIREGRPSEPAFPEPDSNPQGFGPGSGSGRGMGRGGGMGRGIGRGMGPGRGSGMGRGMGGGRGGGRGGGGRAGGGR